jgi:hypothetical protein
VRKNRRSIFRTTILTTAFILSCIFGISGFGSEVSFTITGKLPETVLKTPRILFRLELISIDPLQKRAFSIYPFEEKASTLYGGTEISQKTITLVHKKIRTITLKEEWVFRSSLQRISLLKIPNIPDPRKTGRVFEDSLRTPIIVSRGMVITVDLSKEIAFVPQKKWLRPLEAGTPKDEPHQLDMLSFSDDIAAPKIKNTWHQPTQLRFGISNTMEYLLELNTNNFVFKKDFDDSYKVSFLFGDAVFRTAVDGENVSASLEKNGFVFRASFYEQLFGVTLIKKEWPFKSLDTGIDFLYPFPLPRIVWYPGSEKHFSLGVGVENGRSYGPSFTIYYEPFWLSVFSGVRLPDLMFDVTAEAGYTIKPIKTNLFAVIGYNDDFYGKIRLETQTFYLNPFRLKGILETGYDEVFHANTEVEVSFWVISLGGGISWEETGLVYYLTVGIRF